MIKYQKMSHLNKEIDNIFFVEDLFRGGSRAAATSKMERFVIKVNGFQPLTIISKRSILDVATALDSPLDSVSCQISEIDLSTINCFRKKFYIKCLSVF